MSDETKAQHTPGPWRTVGSSILPANETASGVALVATHRANWRDNARLIAAAPDLLAAARAHDAYLSAYYSGPDSDALGPDAADAWRKARAAIAKAEGR